MDGRRIALTSKPTCSGTTGTATPKTSGAGPSMLSVRKLGISFKGFLEAAHIVVNNKELNFRINFEKKTSKLL